MNDETAAYVAVTRLQARYADVVTRRAWPELERLFRRDALVHVDTVTSPVIELVGVAALSRFVAEAVNRFEFFEFVPLNTVVRVEDGDRARGRLYMVEVRQERDSGRWSNAFGVYHDQYVRSDDGWRFAERHYQSMARRTGTEPAAVFPFPASFVV